MNYRLVLVFVALALIAAACGDSTVSPETTAQPVSTVGTPIPTTVPAASGFPVTLETVRGPLTIERRPERIVSLSATATETMFAIGAGGQVAAVDEFSNYPPEAPTTDLSGFQPNLEAIAEFTPDLVVIAFDPGDLATGLTALGIPTLVTDAAAGIDDAYAEIALLGAATGQSGEASALVAAMQAEIEQIVAGIPDLGREISYYHELGPGLYTVTSATFAGEIYALAGLHNIADAADAGGIGYPQLSAEYLIEQDPDIIFLADTKCCAESITTLATRAGWDQLTALSENRVIELDDDIASRWGPRIVDFLGIIADTVAELPAAAD